ncbi:pre-mRNA-splicing ATP-dependent RNA helicase prp28-like [Copidosoma floridanum]|uniref:pre-mRNA-splicing ATP-dependent RNA helicase prp28-like n=1 Tax=Copidosoma floridanum TaxID=29053 RepID=UPI0006C96C15|nr:pre-mRNA-splicing ATP-dependent RNA helicase prp28-like [Copidosoma floridanum]
MLYGTTLRVPGDFFATESQPVANPATFVEGVDAIRKLLQPPYTGPHQVIRSVDDKTYVIHVNGSHRTVSTDALKPAYVEATDSSPLGDQPTNPPNAPPADSSPAPKPPAATPETAPKDAPPKKRVSFSPLPTDLSGEGVVVVPSTIDRQSTHRRSMQAAAEATRGLRAVHAQQRCRCLL